MPFGLCDAQSMSQMGHKRECRWPRRLASQAPVYLRLYVLSLKRRLTLDVTARVTRMSRAEPQTRRARELSLVMLKFTKRSLRVEMLGSVCGLSNPII
jgi:hypothetical protein